MTKPNLLCILLLACSASLAALDLFDRSILGPESYTDSSINIRNITIVAPSGSLTAIINAGGRIGVQPIPSPSPNLTRVQLGSVLRLVVPNQPPVVANVGSSANPVTSVWLSAIGADDGGAGNLSYAWTKPSSVTWATGNTGSAVSATFPQAGSYTFGVAVTDQGGLTASASITVTVNQIATSVHVTPNVTSTTSAQQQFTATIRDQFGIQMISQAISWTVVSGTGTVSASGLFTAAGVGSSQVRAALTANPGISAVGTISITAVGQIVVTPNPATVVVTESAQFTARLVDQYGVPLSPQPAFAYSVNPVSVGTINSSGLFTAAAVAGGPYSVVASASGYAAKSSPVTLVPPPVVYLDTRSFTVPILTPNRTWVWNNTYHVNNYALGRGWIVSSSGVPTFNPDRVNFSGTRGNSNSVMMFINSADARVYFGLNNGADDTAGGRVNSTFIQRMPIGPGYVSGPADRLQFAYDLSAGPRTYYLRTNVSIKLGDNVYPGRPIQVEADGLMISTASGTPIGYGTATISNIGPQFYSFSQQGQDPTSGYYPGYTLRVLPYGYQNYQQESLTLGDWSYFNTLPSTITSDVPFSRLVYKMTQSSGGGAAFSFLYDSTVGQSQTGGVTGNADGIISFFTGFFAGSLTWSPIVPN